MLVLYIKIYPKYTTCGSEKGEKLYMDDLFKTTMFKIEHDKSSQARKILSGVYEALTEKGYDPVRQLVGYFISGDPTYITNHKNARSIISEIDRDELLMELVKEYLKNSK